MRQLGLQKRNLNTEIAYGSIGLAMPLRSGLCSVRRHVCVQEGWQGVLFTARMALHLLTRATADQASSSACNARLTPSRGRGGGRCGTWRKSDSFVKHFDRLSRRDIWSAAAHSRISEKWRIEIKMQGSECDELWRNLAEYRRDREGGYRPRRSRPREPDQHWVPEEDEGTGSHSTTREKEGG